MHSLFEKPLPTYSPQGPQGSNLLCICSEAFYKWKANFHMTSRIISRTPTDLKPAASSTPTAGGPRFFYPATSAHLSQSDFGVLFPWFTKKAFKAEEPERTLRLNVRAVLQVLRESGIPVAPTSREDMETTTSSSSSPSASPTSSTSPTASQSSSTTPAAVAATGDPDILATDGRIRAWIPLSLSEGASTSSSGSASVSTSASASSSQTAGLWEKKEPFEAVMEGEVMQRRDADVKL
jgi:hypothetical protein